MKTIADALAEWNPPSKPVYEPDNYPFHYAVSFLIEQPRILPREITGDVDRKLMTTPNSKGEQRKKRYDKFPMTRMYLKAWLEVTGEDPWKSLLTLADRYLELHEIEGPADRHDTPSQRFW